MSRADASPTAQEALHGVLAHTPNPTGYTRDGSKTIVPRAVPGRYSGLSQGFSPMDKQVVILNPLADGSKGERSRELDMSLITKEDIEAVMAEGYIGETAWDRLADKAEERKAAQAAATLPPAPAPAPAPVPAPVPSPAPPAPAAAPDLATTLAALGFSPEHFPMLAQLAATPVNQASPSPSVSPEPLPQPVAVPTAPSSHDAQDYAELGFPWLKKSPAAPQVRVVYFYPHGVQRTKCHAAYNQGRVISLVYDNRCDGEQFIPAPLLDDNGENRPIRVEVPDLDISAEVGVVEELRLSLGCFDIVNLLIVEEASEG